MITFIDYLEEMSSQDEYSRVISNVPEHKRESFRQTYDQHRKKGLAGRAALMYTYRMHMNEELDLKEMAKHQYAVVDDEGKRHYMTDDEKSAHRVAKEKGMKVVHKFYKKDRNFIPIKQVKEESLEEVYINGIKKRMNVGTGDRGIPEGEHVSSFQGHNVYQSKHDAWTTFHCHDPKTNKTTLAVSGKMNKAKTLSDLSLFGYRDNKVKAHDFYHHLITHHGITLQANNQSEGAKRVWQKLAKKKGVGVHGWHNGKPVNVTPHDEDEVYSNQFDSVGKTTLVAHKLK